MQTEELAMKVKNGVLNPNLYLRKQRMADLRHLKQTGELEEFKKCHGHHYGFLDVDTFFSISFSMLGAKNGISGIYHDIAAFANTFNVDTLALSSYLTDAGSGEPIDFDSNMIYR